MVSPVTPSSTGRSHRHTLYPEVASPATVNPMLFLQQPSNPGHDRKELEIHRAAGTHNPGPITKVSRETFFSQWAILSGNTEEFLLQTPKYFMKTLI